jgi:glycosyltransferase involved in cell wall biosynthesis
MILFVGPTPPPTHGQSIAFQYLIDNLCEDLKYVSTTYTPNKTLNTICVFVKLFITIVLKGVKIESIYLSGSRSFSGMIKEWPIYLLARTFRFNLFIHAHGLDITNLFRSSSISFRFFVRPILDRLTLIVLNEQMIDKSIKEKVKDIQVLHNFYGKDFENQISWKDKENIILFFSNIMKSKGIIEFLDALPLFLEKNRTYTVQICGGFISDYLCDLKTIQKEFYKRLKALEEKFPKRVIYRGVLTGNNRVNILLKSKIFILPTYHKTEAIPLSIIEAMRCGLYIITTNHNLLPSLINKSNGTLIQPQSKLEVLRSLLHVTEDDKMLQKTSDYNWKYSKKRYSGENHIKNLRKIIFEKTS